MLEPTVVVCLWDVWGVICYGDNTVLTCLSRVYWEYLSHYNLGEADFTITSVDGHQNQLNESTRYLPAPGTAPAWQLAPSPQEPDSGAGCGVGSPEALGISVSFQKSSPVGNGNIEKPRALRMAQGRSLMRLWGPISLQPPLLLIRGDNH